MWESPARIEQEERDVQLREMFEGPAVDVEVGLVSVRRVSMLSLVPTAKRLLRTVRTLVRFVPRPDGQRRDAGTGVELRADGQLGPLARGGDGRTSPDMVCGGSASAVGEAMAVAIDGGR